MKHSLLAVCVLLLAGTVLVQTPTKRQTVKPPAKKAGKVDKHLEDWPDLNRYRAANKRLSAPAPDERRVVFMGDSITEFWDLARAFPGRPYVNRGISGQTTPQMLLRFRPDVIELKPQAVVILAGTNDIAGNTGPMTDEEITGNLASMCELARAHGIRVVLASILPVHDYAGFLASESRPPRRIRALNEWMKNYAAQHGHAYLDYFSALTDDAGMLRAELADDGLHPNDKGYAVMAPLADKALRAALN
jgi:lysophospholipase L1-like esterase